MSLDRKNLIKLCQKFWRKEKTEKPLVGALYNRISPLQWFTDGGKGKNLHPEDLSKEMFINDCQRRHRASQQIKGDAIYVAFPFSGIPWSEGVMGCKVKIGNGSCWSEILEDDWRNYTINSVPWNNGWFDKIQELTETAIEFSKGKYPIGPVHLRSPVDLVPALLGEKEFCLSLYDHPEEIHKLVEISTEVWEKIVNAQYDLLTKEEGGYWNANQPMWAPGKNMFVTADASALISPGMFKKFFLSRFKKMLKDLEWCIMHTHSSSLHVLDLLMPINELKAIQVGIDPNGPSLKELIPKFHKILSKKTLIIGGVLNSVEINTLISELPSEGLCIYTYLETIEECNRVINKVSI
ncbi:MAG: hypothetical protein ACOCQA_02370 [bacterium]